MQQTLMRLACVLGVMSLAAASDAEARPFRGATPVQVLLCQTSDDGAAPRTLTHYRNMLFNAGTGGLADWWRDMSYGSFSNAGSAVRGWYRMPQTTEQYRALSRSEKRQACVDAARNAASGAYTLPAGMIYYVVTSPSVDMFGWTGGAFLPWNMDVGAVAHEGGHGIGMNHTFSNDPTYRNASWSQIGEYDDPWDVMSWANSYRATTTFGDAPAGVVSHHLDRMGWMPRTRIARHGANGVATATYTLAATNHPTASGSLMIRVPFDPSDLFRYYTVEFRQRSGWSAGIPASTVLIHEVKRNKNASGVPVGAQVAWLQRDLTRSDKAPTQILNANGVRISVSSINDVTHQAVVSVTSNITERCLQGYVWREARPTDRVCVPPAERTATQQENALAASRRAGSGPYGPDTCIQGYVWREAYSGDRVCVTPASRTRAAQSNSLHASRVNPARFVYGPNTCKQGYVWREADASDWVCVTPETRTRTATENSLAASRRAGSGAYGPDTCLQGYVWREAFPGDRVCVPGSSRTAAQVDNGQAQARLAIE